MNIGIIGNGFVGQATKLLECDNIRTFTYDIVPEKCDPPGLELEDLCDCPLIFVAVPTPMQEDGSCHLGIVEQVVADLKAVIDEEKTFIVIRSTVVPGTCDRLGCYFMPEFLTEKNWQTDFQTCENWFFGQPDENPIFKTKIRTLLTLAKEAKKIESDQVHFLSNKEVEMIKYFRNTYLATKVSFCNEMEEFTSKLQIDYETVRYYATLDKRIGSSHSRVPGPDGKWGFGGTCFPKDTNSLLFEIQKAGMESYIMRAVVERNEKVDRPEKDWKIDKGRAVI